MFIILENDYGASVFLQAHLQRRDREHSLRPSLLVERRRGITVRDAPGETVLSQEGAIRANRVVFTARPARRVPDGVAFRVKVSSIGEGLAR